jgi:hypothetical protein
MKKRFIAIVAGAIVGSIILEDNIKALFGGTIPDETTLNEKGFATINEDIPSLLEGENVVEDGLEVRDGVVYMNYKVVSNHDDAKAKKKMKLKGLFSAKVSRPVIDTSLGFSVDGSKDDLANFEIAKSLNLDFVKDADGKIHQIELSDWDVIITAIKQKGVSLFQEKWEIETQIDACTTTQELADLDISGAFGTAVAEEI